MGRSIIRFNELVEFLGLHDYKSFDIVSMTINPFSWSQGKVKIISQIISQYSLALIVLMTEEFTSLLATLCLGQPDGLESPGSGVNPFTQHPKSNDL